MMPKQWVETAVLHDEPIDDIDLTNTYYFYRIVVKEQSPKQEESGASVLRDVDLRKSRRDN